MVNLKAKYIREAIPAFASYFWEILNLAYRSETNLVETKKSLERLEEIGNNLEGESSSSDLSKFRAYLKKSGDVLSTMS